MSRPDRSGAPSGPGPAVSVVIAAYNRAHLLRHAIASVLAQDFQDFEVLVIGDHCTDDSGEVVASFADPRVSFENLPVNFGDQSGPNNVGITRARGRYIAFLNQDDMWLKDHLSVCLEWIEATGADIVHAAVAAITAGAFSEQGAHWIAGIGNSANGTFFDPCSDVVPCSSWFVRAETFEKIGVMRPALECVTASSEDWVYRAWRAGLVHRAVPNLSVVMLTSGERENSYRTDRSVEHDSIAEFVRMPDARRRLLSRMAAAAPERQLWRRALIAAIVRPLARLGVPPRPLRHRMRHEARRGDFIQRLRRTRGLDPIWHAAGGFAAIRLRDIAEGPAYVPGTRIEFTFDGAGLNVREWGWGLPEPDGTWTEGEKASVVFPLGEAAPGDLELAVEATPFLESGSRRQRVVFRVGEVQCADIVLDKADGKIPPVRIASSLLPRGHLLRIVMELPDARAPSRGGVSSDIRPLGLKVHAMTLRAAD